MLKKTMALVLTLMMTAALAVPMVAVATGSSADYGSSDYKLVSSEISSGTSKEETIPYQARTDVPVLKLKLSGGGGIVMNPYGIARNTTQFDTIGGGSSTDASQIISTKLKIESKTIVPVKVGATVRAAVAGKASLATGKLTTKDNTNKVALWLVAWESGNAVDSDTQFKTFERQTANAEGHVATTGTNAQSATAGVLFVKNVYVTGKSNTENVNASMYTIPEGSESNPKQCHFQFFGDMVAEPLNSPWTTTDTVTPTLILNFQLQELGA